MIFSCAALFFSITIKVQTVAPNSSEGGRVNSVLRSYLVSVNDNIILAKNAENSSPGFTISFLHTSIESMTQHPIESFEVKLSFFTMMIN